VTPNCEDPLKMTSEAQPADANAPLPELMASAVTADQRQEPADPLQAPIDQPREVGGREGPEPTRYGDWEMRGRCIDF
jgi:hypothetical protein